MDESQVKAAIDGLITFLEACMAQETNRVLVTRYGRWIDALIALEHDLRLCGCPPEVYEKAGEA